MFRTATQAAAERKSSGINDCLISIARICCLFLGSSSGSVNIPLITASLASFHLLWLLVLSSEVVSGVEMNFPGDETLIYHISVRFVNRSRSARRDRLNPPEGKLSKDLQSPSTATFRNKVRPGSKAENYLLQNESDHQSASRATFVDGDQLLGSAHSYA